MYGDTDVMRRRVQQLRDQGTVVRATADQLVARTEAIAWSGRAADALRDRIRERATHLRDVAARHDTAADSLERHLHQVDRTKDAIADAERRAAAVLAEGAAVTTTTPPPGHRDWLTIELTGR